MSGIYLVTKELTLRITFTNKQIYKRIFKIPQPTNNVDLLFRMLHTHLENFKSEHPIVAVALSAQPIKPAREQFGLFETTLRNPQQLLETLARLIALLSADRVGTPVLKETHRPDAFRMEAFVWNWISTAGNGGRSSATPEAHPKARGNSPSIHYAWRCADFGQVYLHPSCWMKTASCMFAAQMFAVKSSICRAHF